MIPALHAARVEIQCLNDLAEHMEQAAAQLRDRNFVCLPVAPPVGVGRGWHVTTQPTGWCCHPEGRKFTPSPNSKDT